jgi:serine/threonine-protein kinase
MSACPACGHDNPDGARFCGACGRPIPESTSNAALVGTTIAERYRVIRVIAEGGMGIVYEALQSMGEGTRTVAIKTLLPELSRDPVVVSRFHRECAVVAGLEHPNTVRVYDFGTTSDGILYIAMEYVRGRPLGDVIAEGPMPLLRCLGIIEQVCSALEEAHGQGIVHRDLKPDNLILCERAGIHDWLKLLDFGIAKRVSVGGRHVTKLTQQGMVLGTPPYMSPEQFTSEPLDLTSDIYSLGIICYEMLNSRLPFEGDTPWQWAHQHMSASPAPFSVAVPKAVQGVVCAALAKRRTDRPPTAKDFYRLLAGAANPGAVVATGALTPLAVPGEVKAAPVRTEPSVFGNADLPVARTEPSVVGPASEPPRVVRTAPSIFADEPPRTQDDTGGSVVAAHTEPSVMALSSSAARNDPSTEPLAGAIRGTAALPAAPAQAGAHRLPFERSYVVAPPPRPRARASRVGWWVSGLLLVIAAAAATIGLSQSTPDLVTPPMPATAAAPAASVATEIAAEAPVVPHIPSHDQPTRPESGVSHQPRPNVPAAAHSTPPVASTASMPTNPPSTAPAPPSPVPSSVVSPLPFPFPIPMPTLLNPGGLPPIGPATPPAPAPQTPPPSNPVGNAAAGLQNCSQATSLAASDLDAAVGQYQTCEAAVGKVAAAPTRGQLITIGIARARALAAQGRCDEANRVVQTMARLGAQRVVREAINQAGCRS